MGEGPLPEEPEEERNVTPAADDEEFVWVAWDTGSNFAGRRFPVNRREYPGRPGETR